MDKIVTRVLCTFDGVREFLLDGKNARDIGGGDAHASRPIPQGTHLPAFLREVHSKAQELSHHIAREAEDEFDAILLTLRANPFAVEGALQKTGAVTENVGIEIKGRVEHNTAEIIARRREADDAAIAYRRGLQSAGAKHPSGGWKDSVSLWPMLAGIVMIESGMSAAILWHALGAWRAIGTGLALSCVAVVGGLSAAFAVLRLTDRKLVTTLGRTAQWALAIFAGNLTLAAIYVGAVYRSVWIAGKNGNGADIVAAFQSPGQVLINFDVLTLAALGLVGFFWSARELFKFYHGFRSSLRDAGIAKTNADDDLQNTRDEMKTFVTKAGGGGVAELDDVNIQSGSWVRAFADCADQAQAAGLKASRDLEMIRRVFESVVADYTDGFQEVRPTVGTSPVTYPVIGTEVEVPMIFMTGLHAAIKSSAQVSDSARAAKIEIGNTVTVAIRQIDELAGYRAMPPMGGNLLPPASKP